MEVCYGCMFMVWVGPRLLGLNDWENLWVERWKVQFG